MGIILLPLFILFVLIVSFIGCLMGVMVGRWRHSAVWGIGTFFLVWAAVLSPEVFVHAQLRYLCKTQGGIHIYETISEPKSLYGVVVVDKSWQEDINAYLKLGYDSIESRFYHGDLYRFWRNKDGQIKRIKIAQPTSHYTYQDYIRIKVNRYFGLNEVKIIDRKTGNDVAVYKNFYIDSTPLSYIFKGIGSGQHCELPNKSLLKIYPEFIQPTK